MAKKKNSQYNGQKKKNSQYNDQKTEGQSIQWPRDRTANTMAKRQKDSQ
jgi:hypothetical protein